MKELSILNESQKPGHYATAVQAGEFVFFSGILPIDPVTRAKTEGTFRERMGQVMKNLDGILASAQADRNQVAKVTVYLDDIALWEEANEIFKEYFGDHKPARTICAQSTIHFDLQVEMDGIIYLGK